MEVHQAKGSARLLHLSLSRSRLVVGEIFDEATLHALLFEPFSFASDGASDNDPPLPVRPLLLYPADDVASDDAASSARTDVISPSANATDVIRHRLVVLDGTWRKSRKMLHLNPLLQHLPRFALNHPPASHYAIRKAHRPDQLSTYEATCNALMQLDGDAEKYRQLLEAFDGFVVQQQSHIPHHRHD